MTDKMHCPHHGEPYKTHEQLEIEYCWKCYEENKKAMLKDLEENSEMIIPRANPFADFILDGYKKKTPSK